MNISSLSSELDKRDQLPSYVQFFQFAKHLPVQSEREGRYIAKDVDMVEVRQLGSVDSVKFEVEDWLSRNKQDVQSGRLKPEIEDKYREMYQRWKKGQDMPIEGTPIKSWPVLSPAQVERCLAIGIRTVEELSVLHEEGQKRLGMGAMSLKQKAKTWIEAGQDKGKLVQQMTTLEQDNALLKANLETLTKRLEALQAAQEATASSHSSTPSPAAAITVEELLDEDEKPKRGKR
ncbi:MAG: hypothetical protein VW518_00875 [Burkholderiaceae bacterium]